MSIFDLLKKRKDISVMEIMEKAFFWTDYYMNNYALQQGSDVKGAVFIFCSWEVWHYCLENDKLQKSNDLAIEYFSSTLVYSGFDKKIDIADFVDVLKTRFKIFNQDIKGLVNSHYPQTKQYLPFSTFCTIYKNQLSLSPTDGVDHLDLMINEQLDSFTGGFIEFWNKFYKDLSASL